MADLSGEKQPLLTREDLNRIGEEFATALFDRDPDGAGVTEDEFLAVVRAVELEATSYLLYGMWKKGLLRITGVNEEGEVTWARAEGL